MFRRLLAIGLLALMSGLSWAAPTSDEYYKAGLKLYLDQRLSDSESYFRAAVQLDPKNWKAYLGLGNTAMKAGKKVLAIAAYEHSLYYNNDQPVLRSYVNSLKLGGSSFTTYVWDPTVDPYPLETGSANPPKSKVEKRQYIQFRTGIREAYLSDAFSDGIFDFPFVDNMSSISGTETFEQIHLMVTSHFSIAVGLEQWRYKTKKEWFGNDGTGSDKAWSLNSNPFTLGFFFHCSSPIRGSIGSNLVLGKVSGDYITRFDGSSSSQNTSYYSSNEYEVETDQDSETSSVGNGFKAIDNLCEVSIDLFPHVTLQVELGYRIGVSGTINHVETSFSSTSEYYYGHTYNYSHGGSGNYEEYFSPNAVHGGFGLQIGF
jgi:hypothetical protein